METPKAEAQRAVKAVQKAIGAPGWTRESVIGEIMLLLGQLESTMNKLPSPESAELVDFVNIIRCRLGQPGPRLVGANREKR